MKLTFDEKETARLIRIHDCVREARGLEAELAICGDVNKFIAAEKAARDAVEAFPPSRLLRFDDDVTAAFTALRRAELMNTGMQVGKEKLGSKRAKLLGQMSRDVQEVTRELRTKLIASFPAATRSDRINTNHGIVSASCVETLENFNSEFVGRDGILGRAEALLKIAAEMGAELPEVAA